MAIQVSPLALPGAYLFTLPHHPDTRGSFTKVFHHAWRELIPEAVRPPAEEWVVRESFFSRSKQGVLRGLHFQEPPFATAKWVICEEGEILDVFVDLRHGSPTFGKAESVVLQAALPQMLFLPVGLAHGFYTRSDEATVLYYCSQAYASEQDRGILWNSIDFSWPDASPILSPRDTGFPALAQYASPFQFGS